MIQPNLTERCIFRPTLFVMSSSPQGSAKNLAKKGQIIINCYLSGENIFWKTFKKKYFTKLNFMYSYFLQKHYSFGVDLPKKKLSMEGTKDKPIRKVTQKLYTWYRTTFNEASSSKFNPLQNIGKFHWHPTEDFSSLTLYPRSFPLMFSRLSSTSFQWTRRAVELIISARIFVGVFTGTGKL